MIVIAALIVAVSRLNVKENVNFLLCNNIKRSIGE